MENENKEKNEVENTNNEVMDNSGITISDEVCGIIAGIAANEVKGVAEMAGGFTEGISEAIKGKKKLSKGIKAEVDGDKVKIDVNIVVEYGAKIPEVAADIQKNIKASVEDMTGLMVSKVVIHVQGVKIDGIIKEAE